MKNKAKENDKGAKLMNGLDNMFKSIKYELRNQVLAAEEEKYHTILSK